MDEINAFFDITKDFERSVAPRGTISGNASAASMPKPKKIKREFNDSSYCDDVVSEQEELLSQMDILDAEAPHCSRYGAHNSTAATSRMDDLEEFSDDEADCQSKMRRLQDDVYKKYDFNRRSGSSLGNPLPIEQAREKIVNTIRKNFVTILEGDTGCGKTTQVPQYILDNAYKNNEYCKIVCTQPRRIAASSVADRVSSERCWPLGSVVGFKVGLRAKLSEDTRIMYCTTGVLLQRLIKEKTLTSFTHIILDEVHERDQEVDFLLIIIRKFLSTNSRNVKVILMSATINTTEFADYFKIRNNPAPVIRVHKGGGNFKVSEYYFDSLHKINPMNYQIDYTEPGIASEMYNITLKLICAFKCIDIQLWSIDPHTDKKYGSVLIFLPGINEIDILYKKLLHFNETDNQGVTMVPIRMHSLITSDEQNKIFHSVPRGHRKVILATNIAESSITIPDMNYVIDFCLMKSLVTDTATNFTSLQLDWASRANCRQRAGRAGRVQKGRVYRMVDKLFYERSMPEYGMPEMLRCPLENVILKAKLLDIDSPRKTLALAMSPPNMNDVFNTILTLKEIGALFRLKGGEYSEDDGDLTFIGRLMASMPLDLRLTRLIILGYIFGCLEETIIIAAGLSVRSIFKFHSDHRSREIACHIQKLIWADGSGSDLISILNAYRVWTKLSNRPSRSSESDNSWAKRYFMNLKAIDDMHLLITELRDRLRAFGIAELSTYQQTHWIDREKTLVLKVVIAGAFYPNYFTHSNLNDAEHERNIYHTLCGHNPCTTVYFTNFNTRHIGQLYTRSIKDLFRDLQIPPKNIDVRFPSGSQRIFVTFKSDPQDEEEYNVRDYKLSVPGKVRPELYKAVRMRLLHINTSIRVMEPNMAIRYAIERGIGEMVEGAWQPFRHAICHPELVALPSVFQKTIRGYITHVESCNKFYFQSLAEMERLREINETLNDDDAIKRCKFANPSEIRRGMTLAAPFNGKYKRARVLKVISPSSQHLEFKVWFIDNGNTAVIGFSQLRYFSRSVKMLEEMPPRVFICRLALVQPSLVKSPHGNWCVEAIESMEDVSNRGKVEIEVYSVVEGVANVILRMSNGTFNDFLVEKGYARNSDETYLSKSDHDYRMRKQSICSRFVEEDQFQQNEEYLRSILNEADEDIPPPPQELCTSMITLRGPFSPLETKIFSAVRAGSWKGVSIERESINSVSLDTDPQDAHERLVVAATVTETQNGDTLQARSTTLMPNIHGFGALMTMLFCPTMQMKTNSNSTKYVSILAGLGYDPENYAPLYEDHDIVLNLDVDILRDDFEVINQMRYCMDSILYTANRDEERPQISGVERANMMAKIKELLIRLLSKERKYIEMHSDNQDNVWQDLSTADMIKPNRNIVYEERSIFPLHSAPKLYDEKFDRMHSLCVHCEELHQISQFNHSAHNVKCLLCNQVLENIVTLRIHLLSQLHRDREHNIRFKLKRK